MDCLFFLLNLILNFFDLLGDFLNESFHDGILFVEPDKDVEQLFALIFDTDFSNADLFSDSVEALFNFHFLHDAFLVFIVNSGIFLFFDFDLFLILLDLFLKFLELFLFDKF